MEAAMGKGISSSETRGPLIRHSLSLQVAACILDFAEEMEASPDSKLSGPVEIPRNSQLENPHEL
jgi:hypothetical protein